MQTGNACTFAGKARRATRLCSPKFLGLSIMNLMRRRLSLGAQLGETFSTTSAKSAAAPVGLA